MNEKSTKLLKLFAGLAVFALLGTLAIYAAGFGRPAKPQLSGAFRFYNSISADELAFSDNEVKKLNRSLFRNREVLEQAILTITGVDPEPYPDKIDRSSELKFSMKIKSKSGMIFTPETSYCVRNKLVRELVLNIDNGARILAQYADNPALKNRDVNIMDM